MSILDEIIIKKKNEVAACKDRMSLSEIEKCVTKTTRDFKEALQSKTISFITEIKRKSPSKGLIRADFDPKEIAIIYETHGASALSVLTDESFFGGQAAYLKEARAVTQLPALRKDFIIDAYQITEARYWGADAILLIAACLAPKTMIAFIERAQALGMASLVEVHSEDELKTVLDTPAEIIGINNRNLATFEVSLQTSLDLKKQIPSGIVTVGESGIHTREDVLLLENAGFDALLVGESLMKSDNIGQQLLTLRGESV